MLPVSKTGVGFANFLWMARVQWEEATEWGSQESDPGTSPSTVLVNSKNGQGAGCRRGLWELVGLWNLKVFLEISPCPTSCRWGKWVAQRRQSLSKVTRWAHGELGLEPRHPGSHTILFSYFRGKDEASQQKCWQRAPALPSGGLRLPPGPPLCGSATGDSASASPRVSPHL